MHLIPALASAPASTATGPDALAARLAQVEPSCGLWDALDVEHLSPQGRLDALVAAERHFRHAHEVVVRAWAAMGRNNDPELDPVGIGLAGVEAATALNLSVQGAEVCLYEGERLARLFPETLSALGAGQVSWRQVRSLLNSTLNLDEETARAVQAKVLPRMHRQTPASTVKALRRAVLALDPAGAARRHQAETERRCVAVRPQEDGMAGVIPA